jgi:hypothetical protein
MSFFFFFSFCIDCCYSGRGLRDEEMMELYEDDSNM